MRALNNSTVPGFEPKASDHASPEYAERVASPIMQAVDAMPRSYRRLVNEYGYVDVFRAWRKGWSPEMIIARAKNGTFVL